VFLDEAKVEVASGEGGDGIVHFRREKYVPRGGPDGGSGGRGGDVVLEVVPTLNTLWAFGSKPRFHAQPGERGGPSNKTGKSASDLIIPVPPGTVVREARTGELIGDLTEHGQRLIVCRGGRGGRGNATYATPSNQAPRMAERGEPGEEKTLLLELRLIADVGIVGAPNAGKSTLLAALTQAHPKIGDYPFTTLAPNLGVAELDGGQTLVLADIPGLIEGAHAGAGLGSRFLRHVQRTRVLIHLIDGTAAEPLADFSQINSELALFDVNLSRKQQIVAVNKIDMPDVSHRWKEIEKTFRDRGYRPLAISAKEGSGLAGLLSHTHKLCLAEKAPEEREELVPVYRPKEEPEAFKVSRERDGGWRVAGKAVERAASMTYWEYDEAVRRFQRLLERLGVDEALRESGAKSGDTVRIGEYELEWQD